MVDNIFENNMFGFFKYVIFFFYKMDIICLLGFLDEIKLNMEFVIVLVW